MPVFRSVFADIGDEQSIAESLSTFSGHIANVVAMERALALPALVLLDEAGAGTDPAEGGALAMAIIEHFRLRGATVIATTHYDSLKSYASTTDGRGAGRLRLRPEDVRADVSAELRLAGQQPGVRDCDAARAAGVDHRAGAGASDASANRSSPSTSPRSQRDVQTLEHERRLVARERETLDESTAKLHAREQELRSREETFRKRLDERIEERLRDARREIDAVVDELKARTGALAAGAERRAARLVPTGATGAARAEARAAVDAIGERLRARAGGRGRPPRLPPARRRIGRRSSAIACWSGASAWKASSRRCTIARPKWTCGASGCAPGSTSCGCSRRRRRRPQPPRVRVNVDLQPRDGSLTELNLIGCRSTRRWRGPRSSSTTR